MIIDFLRQEHRNIEKLLIVLENELKVFDRGEKPDYEVIGAVIAYFEVYLEIYHHPQEDAVFQRLKSRNPVAAEIVGDLAGEHQDGAERLRKVSQAIESVLADRIMPRQIVDDIIRNFILHERRHIDMEERDFFPAAINALQPQDWAEITSTSTEQKRDPLFSEVVEQRFDVVRQHILQLEQQAEEQRAESAQRNSHVST